MEIFKKGDRVIHPRFGFGIVEVGDAEGKVTIDFDQMGRKQLMLQYAQLRFATPSEEDAAKPGGKTYEKWLKTFVFEDKETKHSLGSHWEPFYDDSTFIIKRFSDILPKALMQVAFADSRPALRSVPTDWPKAAYLTWPLRIHGLSLVIRVTPGNPNEIVSLFPFCTEGCQQRIIIDKVYVWKSGVEAQVEAILGEVCITFFDILYARNRDWYEAGVSYQFILTGIAYTCRKAEDQIVEITNPEVVEAIRKSQIESGDEISYKDRIPIHTKGMASLLPINEWDRDDYQFHGPVKSVEDIEVLGQIGWRVRTTVLRQLSDDNEFDLDIIVTKKVWGNKSPPQIGDDIEGTLWLQGYLWYPDSKFPSNEEEKGLRGLVSSNSYNGYKEDMKYTCPCCGYKTLAESGNYDLCPICYWEEDPSQYEDPDLEGGPNSPSLRQAQLNFIHYGACDQECLSYVRPPGMWDVRDPAWLPLHQIQENILTLQKEFEKNCDLPVTLFKSVSCLFFKEKLDRCRKEKKDERSRNKKYQEEYRNAKSDALGKIKDEQIRHWLIKAESINDVEFIVKAKGSFWKWLEKVKVCSHLHLELIADSNGFAPLYNCRYCGAYVGCTCFFRDPNSWPVNQYISVRPSAISDFIPFRVFKEIFIKPNICYICRKDEDMAAPRAYGKNKIEKVYWRELFDEEGKAWIFLRGKEFQTGEEIINYSKYIRPNYLLFHTILSDDKDAVIKRILDRALYVKNRLRKIGVFTSVKEILGYAVHKACYLYNNQYKLKEEKDKLINLIEKPQTIYLPGFHSNKAMIEELGLLKNPDKIKEMPLIFKVDVLREFLIEEVSVDEKEAKKRALSQVKVFEFDPVAEFQRLLDAARIKDIYLFLKTVQKIWQKDRAFFISKKETLIKAITNNSIEWMVMEYELFCEGHYSGFELGLECNGELLAWLKANVCIPKFMDMLLKGNIITNVVGMRFIGWAKYLSLDEYLNDKMAELVREPDNQHDENAIAVETESFGRLGYVKRSVAKTLAPIMDNGVRLMAEIFARYYTDEIDTTIFLKIKTDKH